MIQASASEWHCPIGLRFHRSLFLTLRSPAKERTETAGQSRRGSCLSLTELMLSPACLKLPQVRCPAGIPSLLGRERAGFEVDNKCLHLDEEHKDEQRCRALLRSVPPPPSCHSQAFRLALSGLPLKRKLGVRLHV